MTTETKAIYARPDDPWVWAYENVGLIHKRINRHRERALLETLDRDDLVQDCLIVAVHAIETYTPDRGASLQTWVSRLVHQHLTRMAAKAPRARGECEIPRWLEAGDNPEDALIARETAEERAGRARARLDAWAAAKDAQESMGLYPECKRADLVSALVLVCDGTSEVEAAAQSGVTVDDIRDARAKWRI